MGGLPHEKWSSIFWSSSGTRVLCLPKGWNCLGTWEVADSWTLPEPCHLSWQLKQWIWWQGCFSGVGLLFSELWTQYLNKKDTLTTLLVAANAKCSLIVKHHINCVIFQQAQREWRFGQVMSNHISKAQVRKEICKSVVRHYDLNPDIWAVDLHHFWHLHKCSPVSSILDQFGHYQHLSTIANQF